MPTASHPYTPAVAAVLSGVAVKTVHNAVDKRIITPRIDASGKRSRRALSGIDVLRLKLWHEVGPLLSPEHRERLFLEVERRPTAKTVKAGSLLIVDVGEARRQIASRERDLDAAEDAIMASADILGGEAVFKGTRIPVRMIARIVADGVDAEELLDGYPALRPEHLDLARIWAVAHPQRGRPKSTANAGLTLKTRTRRPLAGDPGPQTSRIPRRP